MQVVYSVQCCRFPAGRRPRTSYSQPSVAYWTRVKRAADEPANKSLSVDCGDLPRDESWLEHHDCGTIPSGGIFRTTSQLDTARRPPFVRLVLLSQASAVAWSSNLDTSSLSWVCPSFLHPKVNLLNSSKSCNQALRILYCSASIIEVLLLSFLRW